MNNAVVLLSGGQDSTTCLFWAKQNFENVFALNAYYGQRHKVEIQAAERVAVLAGVSLKQVELRFLSQLVDSDMFEGTSEIKAEGGFVDKEMPQGLPTSFVPLRNLFLLSAGAAYAVKVGARAVVGGMCQTDFSGYPDCRQNFMDGLQNAWDLALPSSLSVRIETPLMYLTKAESVKLARRLPGCWEALACSHTCYKGQVPPCGECPACKLRWRGFTEAGELDPLTHPQVTFVSSSSPNKGFTFDTSPKGESGEK